MNCSSFLHSKKAPYPIFRILTLLGMINLDNSEPANAQMPMLRVFKFGGMINVFSFDSYLKIPFSFICLLKAKSPMFSSITLLGTIKTDSPEPANALIPIKRFLNSGLFEGRMNCSSCLHSKKAPCPIFGLLTLLGTIKLDNSEPANAQSPMLRVFKFPVGRMVNVFSFDSYLKILFSFLSLLKANFPMFSSITLLGTIILDNFEPANARLPMLRIFKFLVGQMVNVFRFDSYLKSHHVFCIRLLKAKSPMFSSLTLLGTLNLGKLEPANAELPIKRFLNSGFFEGRMNCSSCLQSEKARYPISRLLTLLGTINLGKLELSNASFPIKRFLNSGLFEGRMNCLS